MRLVAGMVTVMRQVAHDTPLVQGPFMSDVEGRAKSGRGSAQDMDNSEQARSLLYIVSIGPLDEDVSLQV